MAAGTRPGRNRRVAERCRCPCSGFVTGITALGRCDVSRCLAACIRTIVATRAGAGYHTRMTECSGQPRGGLVACIATL